MSTPQPSVYYMHSGASLASRMSLHIRKKMFAMFMEQFAPNANTTILDVGVTSDREHPESNYFERMYPHPYQITAVGTEDGSHLIAQYPGLRYLQVVPGEPLPFKDKEFDIVFSNAVLEHVGSRTSQANFIKEVCRVGKSFFVTTPNRWFPFEHHTGLPLLHFLPPALFRTLIRNTRYGYWADERTLNILTAQSFAGLFPKKQPKTVKTVRVFGLGSNLVAYGKDPVSG